MVKPRVDLPIPNFAVRVPETVGIELFEVEDKETGTNVYSSALRFNLGNEQYITIMLDMFGDDMDILATQVALAISSQFDNILDTVFIFNDDGDVIDEISLDSVDFDEFKEMMAECSTCCREPEEKRDDHDWPDMVSTAVH